MKITRLSTKLLLEPLQNPAHTSLEPACVLLQPAPDLLLGLILGGLLPFRWPVRLVVNSKLVGAVATALLRRIRVVRKPPGWGR